MSEDIIKENAQPGEEVSVPVEDQVSALDSSNTNDEDFLDQIFPHRKQYRGLGPKDCVWPDADVHPVTFVELQRQTNHDGETFAVRIPVFANDTKEDLDKRFAVLTGIADFRMRENNKALQIAQEIAKKEEAEKKRKEQQATFERQLEAEKKKAMLKLAKKGKLNDSQVDNRRGAEVSEQTGLI